MAYLTTHLWFDTQAQEAATFYTSLFKDSAIKDTTRLHNTPSGSVDIITIDLAGHEFTLLNAGPLFKFNPSISFLISCDTAQEVDRLYEQLSHKGSALMELGPYPFSKRYAWVIDKYGLSWQIMHVKEFEHKITPTLMFVGSGRAEEAINFYVAAFNNSKIGPIVRYDSDEAPDKEGTIKHASFILEGQEYAAMDSARMHGFTFNEAISLMVHCTNQQEIDYYWSKLSADPQAEQCGWLKDKFGVSWQVVPASMEKMLKTKDEHKLARVTETFLKMKKFDIAELERAYEGK